MNTLQKTVTITIFAGFASLTTVAQNAREAAVKVNKVEQKAIVSDYSYSKSLVEAALTDKFSKSSFGKSKSRNGYDVYSGVIWAEVAPNDKLDVWTKTEEKKGITTLTILISKGYDNFMTGGTDATAIENLKNFMNNLTSGVVAMDLLRKIEEQEKVVRTTEGRYNDLKKEAEKLQHEKLKVEKNIEQNTEAQRKTTEELEAEKAKLEQLRAQVVR